MADKRHCMAGMQLVLAYTWHSAVLMRTWGIKTFTTKPK